MEIQQSQLHWLLQKVPAIIIFRPCALIELSLEGYILRGFLPDKTSDCCHHQISIPSKKLLMYVQVKIHKLCLSPSDNMIGINTLQKYNIRMQWQICLINPFRSDSDLKTAGNDRQSPLISSLACCDRSRFGHKPDYWHGWSSEYVENRCIHVCCVQASRKASVTRRTRVNS